MVVLTCPPAMARQSAPWTVVSFPDFFNFDVPHPWAQWDESVDWFLDQVKAEAPEFVLVAGDTVNGHWWDGPRCIEQMGALYYEGWKRRLECKGLKYYVAIGDHDLGDDPWPDQKFKLLPDFERVFVNHMQMPTNGPEHQKGLAYFVRHRDVLLVTVETFERRDGKLHLSVTGEQLDWLRQVLRAHADANHIIVQGHVPIWGPVASRSSSKLMLEGGKSSEFYQVLQDGGVDLYLCGEHHAVTVGHSEGLWQIVHGSSWGRKVVDTMDYLVCDIYPDRLELAIKSFPMHASGDHMWNLHKENGPREIVEIPDTVKIHGPETIGTLTIQKTGEGRTFTRRTGVFE